MLSICLAARGRARLVMADKIQHVRQRASEAAAVVEVGHFESHLLSCRYRARVLLIAMIWPFLSRAYARFGMPMVSLSAFRRSVFKVALRDMGGSGLVLVIRVPSVPVLYIKRMHYSAMSVKHYSAYVEAQKTRRSGFSFFVFF